MCTEIIKTSVEDADHDGGWKYLGAVGTRFDRPREPVTALIFGPCDANILSGQGGVRIMFRDGLQMGLRFNVMAWTS